MITVRDEKAVFGCAVKEIDEIIDRYNYLSPITVAVSILSDVQELLERNENEKARQRINVVKYILTTRCDSKTSVDCVA